MEQILEGLSLALTWESLIAIILGVAAGQILGAIPGLTASMAVALLIPYSFYFSPWVGIPMLLGMFKGSLFGSSTTAILIRTPGTPAASATILDGYPLAQQGKGAKAIKMALYSSVFGDTFSDVCLIFFASLLAIVALSFGPAEYTVLIAVALASLGMLSSRPAWKGLISMLLGVTIGIIGLDPITATERLTFGSLELEEGIGLIPMLIGFLAVSEVFRQMDSSLADLSGRAIRYSPKREDNRVSWAEFRGCLPVLFRSSALGTMIGALPGLGSTVAAFLAYGEARRTSPHPERFGTGVLEGVAAPEAANNAVSGANLIPLLAFGIPGDIAAALILSAFMIQGINVGPLAFSENPVPLYAIYGALLMANMVNLVLGQGLVHVARFAFAIPRRLLLASVLVIASAGSYALRGSLFDVQLVFVFGVLGFVMIRYGFPTVPLLIGFILMPLLEENLRTVLLLASTYDENILFVFTRPAFLSLTGLIVLAAAVFGWRRFRLRRGAIPPTDS
ncbi:MAG TPA: tripartite tricarboxylate transporter permease [Alphaproteobacteria bacterium]|jgi:putative tricarboxylic transport membrane protein|nr:tripartite tricarboxylate transporter permease [Alphaproteobacteria bacterium]